jgi:hypothetical protein
MARVRGIRVNLDGTLRFDAVDGAGSMTLTVDTVLWIHADVQVTVYGLELEEGTARFGFQVPLEELPSAVLKALLVETARAVAP